MILHKISLSVVMISFFTFSISIFFLALMIGWYLVLVLKTYQTCWLATFFPSQAIQQMMCNFFYYLCLMYLYSYMWCTPTNSLKFLWEIFTYGIYILSLSDQIKQTNYMVQVDDSILQHCTVYHTCMTWFTLRFLLTRFVSRIQCNYHCGCTAKLLFHQSPTRRSDYMLTGQWQFSHYW